MKRKLIFVCLFSVFISFCSKKFNHSSNEELLNQFVNQGLICKEFKEYFRKNWQKSKQYDCYRYPNKLDEFLRSHSGCLKISKAQAIDLLGKPARSEVGIIVYYMDDDCTWAEFPHGTHAFQLYFNKSGIFESYRIFPVLAN